MAVAASGLPKALADALIRRMDASAEGASQTLVTTTKYLLVAGILAMAIMSQNLIPVHIAFIPLLIPPLLTVMNQLHLDRRLIACVLTFGLVTTYMTLPVGFGKIFLEDILLGNIENAGLDTSGVNIIQVMAIPALGRVSRTVTGSQLRYCRQSWRSARSAAGTTLEIATAVMSRGVRSISCIS